MTNKIASSIENLLTQGSIVIFFTYSREGSLRGREMTILRNENQSDTIWFVTNKNSKKIKDLEHKNQIILSAFDPFNKEKVAYFGIAEIIEKREEKAEIWKENWNSYWIQGFTSDNLVLIKVKIT